jgi:hypothetical protein
LAIRIGASAKTLGNLQRADICAGQFGEPAKGKRALRQRLATAPIIQELRLLDALHERAVAVRGARFREATAVQEKLGRYGDRKEKTS